MEHRRLDVAIIGGGIVGLATALALTERFPTIALTVLEKEARPGEHQTGHNSGVIHSGIYYRPGSFKARLCRDGAVRMERFCEETGVRVGHPGKVIVATSPGELSRLDALLERGRANGVPGLERIGPERLREIEPHAAGLAAIHSPGTSTVDFREVAAAMAGRLAERGAELKTGARVVGIRRDAGAIRLETTAGEVVSRKIVNCAGLHSDTIARMAGADPGCRIVPFRGEYYQLRPERHSLIRGLIYPVPDPEFPFLGVHFTRTVHGEVEAGPNAVLAFAREGYRFSTIDLRELASILAYPGFRAMVRKHWRMGSAEMIRSLSRRAFARALRRLVPEIRPEDLTPEGAGVRAQAVDRDGTLADDFRIVEGPDAIHVLNAPSPAATASLAIGEHIAALAARRFGLAPGGTG